MTPVEIYGITVLMCYTVTTAALLCVRETKGYTRNKDIKNACANIEDKIKKEALPWGIVWPAWLLYKVFKK